MKKYDINAENMLRNSINPYAFFAAILIFSVSFKFGVVNTAMGEAVPLIPLNSRNATLDKGIPIFYKCIQKEIKGSTNVNDDPYFKSEPTKDEVLKCYNSTFLGLIQNDNVAKERK